MPTYTPAGCSGTRVEVVSRSPLGSLYSISTARLDAMAHAHRERRGRPAREIGHGGIEARLLRLDERRLGRGERGAHQRHAERLDAEDRIRAHALRHPVDLKAAEPGFLRDAPA